MTQYVTGRFLFYSYSRRIKQHHLSWFFFNNCVLMLGREKKQIIENLKSVHSYLLIVFSSLISCKKQVAQTIET